MRPRFSLLILLVIVTLVALGFGVRQRLYVQRPVTEVETSAVTPGVAAWQVRWRLGAPHDIDVAEEPEELDRWTFNYAPSEARRFGSFEVTFNRITGCVHSAERKSYYIADP
jgi:hypothetical protein